MTVSVHDQVEELVLYLSEADMGRVSRQMFDGCEPMTNDWIAAREVCRRLIPLRIPLIPGAMCTTVTTPSDDSDKLQFRRTRVLHNALTPGWARRRYRHCVTEDFAYVAEQGDSTESWPRMVIGSNDTVNWFLKDGTNIDSLDPNKDWHVGLHAAIGLWWRQQRTWRVLIGFGDGPRLSLETGPEGAKEIFRLRDIPPGKLRRAALRHWVREHWRQSRGDAVAVRKHLRGATDFTWRGLSGFVFVPSEAMEEQGTILLQEERDLLSNEAAP